MVWVIPKITSADLRNTIHDILHFSSFICPFASRKCEKEGKKITKIWMSLKEKSLFDKMKSIFHSFYFEVLPFGEKNKN